MSARLTLTLPWPEAAASPNARVHWSLKSRAARRMRGRARLETLAQLGGRKVRAIGYRIVGLVTDRRRRDRDNLAASCKAYLDGIAAALGQDDCVWKFHGVEWRVAAKKGVAIVLTLLTKEMQGT
jgi:crossover junction endodeoxyribonuclease RusA